MAKIAETTPSNIARGKGAQRRKLEKFKNRMEHLKVARKARKNTSRKNSKLAPSTSVSENVALEAFTRNEISSHHSSLIQVSAEDRMDPSSPYSESSFRPYHDEPEERQSLSNPIDKSLEEPEVFDAEPGKFSLYNPYLARAYMSSEHQPTPT